MLIFPQSMNAFMFDVLLYFDPQGMTKWNGMTQYKRTQEQEK